MMGIYVIGYNYPKDYDYYIMDEKEESVERCLAINLHTKSILKYFNVFLSD